jgi:hypothetical protein
MCVVMLYSCEGGQHSPCSGKAHNDGAWVAAMGGSNVCSCEGGSNVAMQLQSRWGCSLYSCKGGDMACAAGEHAAI